MLSNREILETLAMVDDQHLDVRTITMGISLFDCVSESAERAAGKIYDKVTRTAERLVPVAEEIAEEIGIPIVNKRVAVTPVSLIGAPCGDFVRLCRALDRAAETVGIDFIGGYTALVQKGMTPFESAFLDSVPEALASTAKVCASVNVASTRAGINMDAVARVGRLVKEMAERTRDRDGLACAKFVAFANAVEDNPFMAGAFCGTGEGDAVINVGFPAPAWSSAPWKR